MTAQEIMWAEKQVWPTLESIRIPCPRPLAGSDGGHWWYNDHEAMEVMEDSGVQIDHFPIVCKTCGLKLKLSVDAPEFPAV